LIKEPKPEQVILYIFNDLILIVEEQTRKIFKRVVVDESFFPRREEDNKIYRNMVTIHSDGFMTFTAGPEDLKINKIVEVY
jgi:adenylate kinase